MTHWMAEMQEGWRALQRRPLQIFELPSIWPGVLPPLLGYDASSRRCLLLPFHGPHAPSAVRSYPWELSAVARDDTGVMRTFLQLSCDNQDANERFSHLAVNVLVQLAAGHVGEEMSCCLRAMDALSSAAAVDNVDEPNLAQVVGLYGELLVLQALISESPVNTSCWTGPLRSPQDFIHHDRSVEVKTTLGEERQHVVHGLGQLSAGAGGAIKLLSLRVTVDDAGMCVQELWESTRSAVPEPVVSSITHLMRTLSKTTTNQKLKVRDAWVYSINDSFPRLVPEDVPIAFRDRVKQLQYVIDLTGLIPDEVMTDDLRPLVRWLTENA